MVFDATEAAQSAQLVIGRGSEATVRLDVIRGTATKVYRNADLEAARRAAAREYRILGQLHRALRDVPGVSCPRPLGLHASPPGVRMEFCRGVALAEDLARHRLSSAAVTRLSRSMARALHAFVLATGETYYDFSTQNMLIDAESGDLVVVDFGIPETQRPLHGHYSPMQISVGNFLGWSIYELARPANLSARLARVQYLGAYRAMRDALSEAGDLACGDLAHVESVARFTYRRLTLTGSALRRRWYRSFGALWLPLALAQARRPWRPMQAGAKEYPDCQ